MTGAGGRPPRPPRSSGPRPVRGPGGGWISEESAARSRDPQGSPRPPGAAGPGASPGSPGLGGSTGSGGSTGGSSRRGDALEEPLGLGTLDESAEPVDDGIAVGLAPPESPGDVLEGHILGDVAAIERERDEYLGALQQLKADFENYRKRVQRQHHEESARAAIDLVNKLLPVLDTLDLAEAHLGAAALDGAVSEAAVTEEAKALSQARGQLLAVLAAEGLERVDEADVEFDPVVHDAVAGEAGGDETIIDEVMRSGYRWRGRVLRPAMVRVRS